MNNNNKKRRPNRRVSRPLNRRNKRRPQRRLNTTRQVIIKSGKGVSRVLEQNKGIVRIPRSLFAPSSILVDLTYPDTTLFRTNGGSNIVSWRYRMTSVFDPDPIVLSGAVPGHLEWATFYNNYRVIAINYSIDISNLEVFSVDAFACPSLTDLGANYLNSNELFGNPYCAQALLSGNTAMNRTRLKGHIDIGTLYGNLDWYLGNDAFGGVVTGNPSVNFFLNVGGTASGLFTGAGLDYRLTITYTVLYNNRKILIA
jgi:hypothetical protein